MPIFVMSSNANNQKYKQLSKLPPAIYLGSNDLSGKIPIEIGQLKFVHYLDLSHNNFSGRIPDQISTLTNLERLDLSHNHLSGEIPASLKGLNFLSFFSVAYNDLQGLVPTGSQFDTLPPPALKEIEAYVALQLWTALALKAFKAFHRYIQLRRDITGRSCLLQLSLWYLFASVSALVLELMLRKFHWLVGVESMYLNLQVLTWKHFDPNAWEFIRWLRKQAAGLVE